MGKRRITFQRKKLATQLFRKKYAPPRDVLESVLEKVFDKIQHRKS